MAEDIKVTENVPSEAQMARAKYWIGTGLGAAAGLTLTYIAFSIASGEWNPLDWPEGFAARADGLPEADDVANAAKAEDASVTKADGKEAAEVKSEDKDATKVKAEDASVLDKETPDVDDAAPAKSAAKTAPAAAAAALPCAADEAVEKVCALPTEQLSATADSSCDGVISLTREALLQDTSYVTPEFVASIENPLVKAVYQAILDGDRSALTTALTNLYTENGYFNPANASGALDGLKDSIIIYPGDQIVINEDGWFLKRAGGEMVQVVNCEGELLDVKEEAMSDTGRCGDEPCTPKKGATAPIIPVEELPMDPITDPDCVIEPVRIGRDEFGNYTGRILTINVYDDLDTDGVPSAGDAVRESNVDARTYFDAHPEDIPDGVRKMSDGYYYNVERYEAYLDARREAMERAARGPRRY